ncbi:hypothetical protein [Anabaena sp. CS-542/02]|uniref:hypothetical protein n=1 Tax=Anabaena sp. CS-542/02 TaxID=3021719 RepID=UPI00232B114A|nr:hypothetical protein [Anabaena sp. CS-542/02]MDB9445459.1 hypothetical protein [Anabaena sp. CS-542/02]
MGSNLIKLFPKGDRAAVRRSLWVEKFPLMLHRDPGVRNPRLKAKVHYKWTSGLPRIPYRQQSTVNGSTPLTDHRQQSTVNSQQSTVN